MRIGSKTKNNKKTFKLQRQTETERDKAEEREQNKSAVEAA
jgi:hypothetical protein